MKKLLSLIFFVVIFSGCSSNKNEFIEGQHSKSDVSSSSQVSSNNSLSSPVDNSEASNNSSSQHHSSVSRVKDGGSTSLAMVYFILPIFYTLLFVGEILLRVLL